MKNVFLIICLYIVGNLGFLSNLFPQDVDYDITDIEKVRERFIEAFGGNFVITEESFKADRNKNIFWLVTVIPKREGFYTIRHIFQNVDGWGYKNNSYEYQISVAKKGVRRFVDYNNRRLIKQACYDLWLGDSITIPISLDEHITSHTFSDESRYGSGYNFDKEAIDDYHNFIEGNFSKWDIKNRVSELEFIGIKNDKMPHRNPESSTVKYYAIFRAKEPGKFNLNIEEYQSIPITILPKKESIKTLVGYAGTYKWEDRVSSSSGIFYGLENACLRVDDILIVTFMNYVEDRHNKRKIEKKLEIYKTDFSILNKGYDYWIND